MGWWFRENCMHEDRPLANYLKYDDVGSIWYCGDCGTYWQVTNKEQNKPGYLKPRNAGLLSYNILEWKNVTHEYIP